MLEASSAGQDRHGLASALRELRKAAGLSGERLAARAHMSQTKVSRIETGRTLPTVTDVERILRALEVPSEQAEQLLRVARATNIDFVSRRQIRKTGVRHRQQELTTLIEQARQLRYFSPAGIPSFLQTYEYAKANVSCPLNKIADDQREAVVKAKLQRKQLLHREGAAFLVLLTEDAVRLPVTDAHKMTEQVDHLISVSRLKSVQMSIIPSIVQIEVPPLNTFVIFDRRLVTMETHAGSIALRDPVHVDEHLELFEYFHGHAVHGDDARELLRAIADDFRRRA